MFSWRMGSRASCPSSDTSGTFRPASARQALIPQELVSAHKNNNISPRVPVFLELSDQPRQGRHSFRKSLEAAHKNSNISPQNTSGTFRPALARQALIQSLEADHKNNKISPQSLANTVQQYWARFFFLIRYQCLRFSKKPNFEPLRPIFEPLTSFSKIRDFTSLPDR